MGVIRPAFTASDRTWRHLAADLRSHSAPKIGPGPATSTGPPPRPSTAGSATSPGGGMRCSTAPPDHAHTLSAHAAGSARDGAASSAPGPAGWPSGALARQAGEPDRQDHDGASRDPARTSGRAEMSTSSARISMHEVEYALAALGTGPAVTVQLFYRSGRKSDRRLCAECRWRARFSRATQNCPFCVAVMLPALTSGGRLGCAPELPRDSLTRVVGSITIGRFRPAARQMPGMGGRAALCATFRVVTPSGSRWGSRSPAAVAACRSSAAAGPVHVVVGQVRVAGEDLALPGFGFCRC
jgi:hypothetical protein